MANTEFNTTWDVQKYFSPHEPAHHWQLRKAFMVENKERFCEERLVCLAQTFANIEFMGCQYPEEITKLVDEMSYGIVQPFREQQKGRLKRTFISGADAAEVKMNKKKLTSLGNAPYKRSNTKTSLISKYGNFVPASIEHANNISMNNNLFDSPRSTKNEANYDSSISITDQINQSILFGETNEVTQNLFGGADNNISMQDAMEQIKILKDQIQAMIEKGNDENVDSSVVCLDDSEKHDETADLEEIARILQGQEEEVDSNSEKQDETADFEEIAKIFQGQGKEEEESSLECLDLEKQDETANIEEIQGIELLNTSDQISGNHESENISLSEFIILRLKYNPDQDPREILRQSAAFCKMSCNFEYKKSMTRMAPRLGVTVAKYECVICIRNDDKAYYSVGHGFTEKDSAISASKKCLEDLEKECYTIMIKQKYTSGDDSIIDSTTFEMKDKYGNVVDEDTPMVQTNIGHKLLKMMGWSKGGLGKHGQGIVEPIKPADLTGRQGLGWNENNGTGRHFKNKVRKILEEYAASNNPYDLVFSSGLTSEQRHEIHVKAAMFKLKHKSFGKGDERFITISRKFQKEEIISQLQKNGGSNAKFELLLPQK